MIRNLLAVLLSALVVVPAARAQERPNLLILSIDTLRADHVSCYGYERPTTPSIDLVAANGTRFAAARSVAPWTLPSFASMFTGRYPTRHGAGASGPVRNVATEPPRMLAARVPTLAEVLRTAGYRTHAITSNPYLRLGPVRGFDDPVVKAVRADRIGALSREWLGRHGDDRPWYLWVHFNDPHEPTRAADAQLRAIGVDEAVLDDPHRGALERWGDRDAGTYLGNRASEAEVRDMLRTKIALYDATIRQVDLEIGLILELLQRRDLLRDTLVVIVADHGEEFLDHAEEGRAWNHDPRGIWGIGHGHTLFEEQLHVPLVLMGPRVRPNQVIAEQFPLTELMPTVLGLLRVRAPEDIDGENRVEWMRDRQRAPIPMAAESLAYGPDWVAWIDGRYKLIADRLGHVQAFYDLERDPYELHDLVAQVDSLDAGIRLQERLRDWNDRVIAEAPPATAAGELTDEMREGLRSLGYVQ
ncbi:MAG TPA: sulfatase [Candidatus Krumholzibacteria bacterium]|nr:sulfatase [Candidatus Krumholzibacteria bacterium]